MNKFLHWLFRSYFRAEFQLGYNTAVDRILLLPDKVYLKSKLRLGPHSTITNSSFVGGDPSIYVEA